MDWNRLMKSAKLGAMHPDELEDWKSYGWWPNGRSFRVNGGYPGHDHEITVNIDGYDGWKEPIPEPVGDAIAGVLPDHWLVENRGSRIECHPAGHYAGGFAPEDMDTVRQALPSVGLVQDPKGP